MSGNGVLHVTAAEGGGADRYIRDLATLAGRHWIWHAAAGVIEDTAARRFYAAPDDAALARWLGDAPAALVHLHGVTPQCRAVVARIGRARALPLIVTLHDIAFVAPRAFEGDIAVDPAQVAAVTPLLASASAVVVPSRFIDDLVHAHFPGVTTTRVAPGIAVRAATARTPPMVAPDFAAQARRLRVAIVGAIGPHKGSDRLVALAQGLESLDATLVVVGYTDTALERGWRLPGALYVHGPYEDDTLGAWLDAYGASVVLFANRLPESFSYALSEAWAARRPVIVPGEGALGERVGALGGGWQIAPDRFLDAAHDLLARLAGRDGAREIAQVESPLAEDDPRRMPTLAAMKDAFAALYARYAVPGAASGSADALAPLVAANVDGALFRRELVRLVDELAAQGAWKAKLEADIAELKAAIDKLGDENRKLADVRDAFVLMPAFVQRFLIKQAFRGRG
jgi:glycosyltransferase involved in cell wall biosynthesis